MSEAYIIIKWSFEYNGIMYKNGVIMMIHNNIVKILKERLMDRNVWPNQKLCFC